MLMVAAYAGVLGRQEADEMGEREEMEAVGACTFFVDVALGRNDFCRCTHPKSALNAYGDERLIGERASPAVFFFF